MKPQLAGSSLTFASVRPVLFGMVAGCVCASGALAEPYKPFQFGLWTFAPTLDVNAIFKDNLYGSSLRNAGGGGVEVSPAFSLTRSDGLNTTDISGGVTAAFYPGHTDANTHAERIALSQTFRPWREQSFTLSGSYSQSSGGLQAPSAGLVSTQSTGDVKTSQVSFGTQRAFGRLVTNLSVSATFSDVQNANNAPIIVASLPITPGVGGATGGASASSGLFAALPSGRSSTVSATAGATYVGPFLSPFVSVGATSQTQPTGKTQSVQVQTGVSVARWRLFRGEAHVGYLVSSTDQNFGSALTQNDMTHSPSVGASVTWDPLRYLAVTFGANAQFGAVALPSISSVLASANANAASGAASGVGVDPATGAVTGASGGTGAATTPSAVPAGTILPTGQGGTTLSYNLSATYSFAARWSANAGLGYSTIRSAGQTTRVETASVGATYQWTRLVDLSLSYAFTRTDENLGTVLGVSGDHCPAIDECSSRRLAAAVLILGPGARAAGRFTPEVA